MMAIAKLALAALVCAAERDDDMSMHLLQMQMNVARGSDTQCLQFMHIPKTGGTSIDAANMNLPIGHRAFDSLMLRTYQRIAASAKWPEEVNLGKVYAKSHKDKDAYGKFLAQHGLSYHWLPEDSMPKCEDLHTPPSVSAKMRSYYDSCTTFCAVREPTQRFWSAYRMLMGPEASACDPKFIEMWTLDALASTEQHTTYHGCFFTPQLEFVHGTRNISEASHAYCNRIIHQENLTAEFGELMAEYGFQVPLPEKDLMQDWSDNCINMSVNDLTPTTRQALYEFYKADYEAFGYPKPNLS
ncbi:unnamed protein product [Effrenium voratum]|nr:unnamed protein product [Effrenium voratum]